MTGFNDNWKLFVAQGKECIKEFKDKKTRKKQIPNLLTASRLLSPFFIIPTALSGNLLLTGIFTGVFALTDAFDGYTARKYEAYSEFGRKLDPITDKIFASSLLIPLAFSNPLILINLIGEAIIAASSVKQQIKGKEPHTIYLGKIKTTLLYVTIALSYLSLNFNFTKILMNSLISTTALFQLLSIIKYNQIFEKKGEKSLDENTVTRTNGMNDNNKIKQKTKTKKLDANKISDWKEFRAEILKKKEEKKTEKEKVKCITKNQN